MPERTNRMLSGRTKDASVSAGSMRFSQDSLPDAGSLIVDSRVTEVLDKGAGNGAFIYVESRARAASDDEPLFTVRRTIVARGDGGFDGSPGPGPKPHSVPASPPDLTCATQTRRDQALLFRLCGDPNPLHADPAVARGLGLQAPVLHGLCTYGIACRAILKTICEYDHTLIDSFDVRFSAPVFPGETLVTEMWQEANIVAFRVRSEERDVVVLNHGRCVLAT